MHPDGEAYYRAELSSLTALRPAVIGSLQLSREPSTGPFDGYLYAGQSPLALRDVPVPRLDGRVWMSLTPMEVPSSVMTIHLARGRVGRRLWPRPGGGARAARTHAPSPWA